MQRGDKCVVLSDSWESIAHYKVEAVAPEKFILRDFSDYLGKGPVREIPRSEEGALFRSPYPLRSPKDQNRFAAASFIQDLAGSIVRESGRVPVDELIDRISKDQRLAKVSRQFVEGCLRSFVAAKWFEVHWDGRKRKNRTYALELTAVALERERRRAFAASFGDELASLSARVGLIVGHTGTVGTYREQLLQTLLQKNLPERYHVASGFVYGCRRQLDIVIYDRLEYAPMFREGDLVVVPREAVRAVIEVKTNLNAAELQDSIELLDDVAGVDDLKPPFFRGIFAFNTNWTPEDLYENVRDFFVREPDDLEDLSQFRSCIIAEPFRHISSICVLGHSYCYVDYKRENGKQWTPSLFAIESATMMNAQAAHFLMSLQQYLRYEGLKDARRDDLLGADSTRRDIGRLVSLKTWGAYFTDAEEGGQEAEVKMLEEHVVAVQNWLRTGSWDLSEIH